MTEFGPAIAAAYAAEGTAIELGRGVHDGKVVAEATVRVPLKMMNRHGLVAGAMGGGVESIGKFLSSRQGKSLQRQVVRGVFGMLKKKL